MTRMVRQKKKWVCSACKKEQIRWSGFCTGCNKVGTLKEVQILPEIVKRIPSAEVKSRQRRAKNSERDISRRMSAIDGADPMFRGVASSTGRVGFITGMQIDGITQNYVIENKNRKLPSWVIVAWVLLQQKGVEFGRNTLLHIEPSNAPRDFVANGVKHKLDTMAVLTQTRHEVLIQKEKDLATISELLDSPETSLAKLRQIKQLLGK